MSHVNLHVHFGKLEYAQPELCRVVREQIGYQGSVWRIVELDDFTDRIAAEALQLWVRKEQNGVVLPDPPPKPLPPQIDMKEWEAEQQRDMQARADEAAAKARLDQYVTEQNLEPSQHNIDAITEWMKRNLGGYFSAAGIDACIANLGPRGRNTLRWTPKAAPAPPPATPAEVLGKLRNGESQLPLDANERTMKLASVAQLQDLIERRRKATNQQYIRRGHGASF